ncbi:MAG TPA: type II toxin-antitoxin system VapC family toxin [Terracidiphilus sp.]|jgi:tRNA(fMet)-specific endonuclease VapC
MKYLLDTNICIALINGSSERVRSCVARALQRDSQLATSSIVLHELWYGVAKSVQVERNARALNAFLSRQVEVLDYTERDAQAAGEIRAGLERRGERIGEYDTLIAGQAFCRNLVLVTANTREFARIKRLVVEDWTV